MNIKVSNESEMSQALVNIYQSMKQITKKERLPTKYNFPIFYFGKSLKYMTFRTENYLTLFYNFTEHAFVGV